MPDRYPEDELSAARTAGLILRQAREQKGLSLEEAARVTRIAKGYLKALEEDRSDKLPNEAYARGFLRAYARHLDLQEEEVLCAFAGSRHDDSAQEEVSEPETDQADGVPKPPAARRLILLFPTLLLTCVIIIAAFLFNREESAPLPTAATVNHRSATTTPVPQTVAKPAAADGDSTEKQAIATDEIPFQTPKSQNQGIILRLKAVEDGALDITIDNMISQHYDLKAGDIIEWKGEKVFVLDLQNAGGVEADFNGRIMAPFGEKGMQAHVRLTPAGSDGRTAP